ncbi:hypothetical protein UXO29_17700 [Enterobacter hormaechei]
MSNKYEDLIKNVRMNAYCGEYMSPAEVTTLLNVVETTYAALAAENAGLKSAIEKHADSYIMCGYCRTERDGKYDDVCEVLDSIPATDALLAEVRASGIDQWIASRNGRWNGTTEEAERFAAQLRKGVQS